MSERELDRGESRKEPVAKPQEAEAPRPEASQQDRSASSPEAALFDDEPGPRYFGEGGYASGGSSNEGNYEARDTNPHGSHGSFDDAGGFGGTRLLGEEASPAEHTAKTPGTPRAQDEQQKPETDADPPA